MDFGKFKYESDMKAREARRNQANTVLKEIRFRLKIDPHDYETKKGHVVRFLEGGDKVKVMIMFRGREQSRPEMGVRLLTRLAEEVADLGNVESMPKQDGRNMTMVLGPMKKKADAKAEQRKRASAVNAQRITKSEARRAAAGGDEDEVEFESAPEPARAQEEPQEAAVPFADVVAAATAQADAAPAPAPVVPEPQAPAAPRAAAPAKAPTAPRPPAPRPVPAAVKPAPARPAPKPTVAKPVAAKPAAPKPVAPKPIAPKPSPRSPR
ncbi:hypothetical protein GCM10007967_06440 [Xylanimonas ulmi]